MELKELKVLIEAVDTTLPRDLDATSNFEIRALKSIVKELGLQFFSIVEGIRSIPGETAHKI